MRRRASMPPPGVWNPLIDNFRHYHGLSAEVGHGVLSEIAARTA
ncbi:hypothetical protein [Streptomyces sp. NPDC048637]